MNTDPSQNNTPYHDAKVNGQNIEEALSPRWGFVRNECVVHLMSEDTVSKYFLKMFTVVSSQRPAGKCWSSELYRNDQMSSV